MNFRLKGPAPLLVARFSLLFVFSCLVFIWFVGSRQSYFLTPAHYDATILTRDEFRQLRDPQVQRVDYADGKKGFMKLGEEPFGLNLYKPIYDGRYYLRVKATGAAYALWFPTSVVVFIFCLVTAVFLAMYQRKLTGDELSG